MKTIHSLKMLLPCAVLLVVGASALRAQLIIPEITIDTQRLPEEAYARIDADKLDSLLTLYVADDRREWNRDDEQYDLPIQINIYFTDYNPNPQEDKYKANLIITNKKEARFNDKRWEFGLRYPFQFNPGEYSPMTAVIEFYVWMLIGIEEDKYEKFRGRLYFDKARQTTLNSSQSIYYYGWDKRSTLLREYVGEENETFRELNFFYYTGIYYDEKRDLEQSKTYLHYALIKLERVPIDVRERFMESTYQEFGAALGRAGYAQGLETLIRLDSANRDYYESLMPPDEEESK